MEALSFDFVTYPDGFFYWLSKNRHIYRRFESMALEMALSGRKRYSAKTIIEQIRWETDLRDTDKTFKINNSYTSGLARYWMETHGDRYPKFFELRG